MLALQCYKVALNPVAQYGYLIHIYSKNHQNNPDLGSYCLDPSLAFTQRMVSEKLFNCWKCLSQYCKTNDVVRVMLLIQGAKCRA